MRTLLRTAYLPLAILACSEQPPESIAQHAAAIGLFDEDLLTQSDASSSDEPSDHFGKALATGDFDNDGYQDLAIGAPDEDDGGTDSGIVFIFLGGSNGIGSGGWEKFTQSSVVTGSNEDGDRFGFSLAAGNFNGDAYDDLAVGVPYEDTDGATDTGLVAIMYGSSGGLYPTHTESITQNSVNGASNETGDRFGYALAAGNFDNDNYDDLAIGVPYEDTGGANDTGLVAIMFGSSSGLLPSNTEVITQTSVSDATNEDGDNFGLSLAAGNFDNDAYDDLAVGVPREDTGGADDTGLLAILYGSSAGLYPVKSEVITQTSVNGTSNEDGDQFGWALAVGDFDDDGYDDLAASAPFEDHDGAANTGMVALLYGSSSGLLPAQTEWITQNSADAGNELNDNFGAALTTADFDDDGHSDLVVGVPFEDVAAHTDNGVVMVFFGGNAGVLPARSYWLRQGPFGGAEEDGDRFGSALAAGDFDDDGLPELAVGAPYEDVGVVQNSGAVFVSTLEPAAPDIEAAAAIVIDTNTGKTYAAKLPDERRAVASTAKMMTALLIIEAANRGDILYGDTVTISGEAAGIGGSEMNVMANDRVLVIDLLYGLMLPSGNDAAIALAEHLDGTEDDFADRMNDRAQDLGLTNTHFIYAHGRDPATVDKPLCEGNDFDNPNCAQYSSARDLAMLARFALSEPMFAQVVRTSRWTAAVRRGSSLLTFQLCNTNELIQDGTGTCNATTNLYNGAYGVKTGTTDLAKECLVAAAARGNEDIISVVLGTEQRYTDSTRLLDYGFQVGP